MSHYPRILTHISTDCLFSATSQICPSLSSKKTSLMIGNGLAMLFLRRHGFLITQLAPDQG